MSNDAVPASIPFPFTLCKTLTPLLTVIPGHDSDGRYADTSCTVDHRRAVGTWVSGRRVEVECVSETFLSARRGDPRRIDGRTAAAYCCSGLGRTNEPLRC